MNPRPTPDRLRLLRDTAHISDDELWAEIDALTEERDRALDAIRFALDEDQEWRDVKVRLATALVPLAQEGEPKP